MPVEVFSSRPIADKALINVSGALELVCEESVEILAALIREALVSSARTAIITEQARKEIPALRNLTLLFEKYLRCFSIFPVAQGFRLKISRDKLREQGLPVDLPFMLEYGSEMGISPMPHLQSAWMKFQRDVVPKLVKKVQSEPV